MNDFVISGKLINRLADVISELRPDWTKPGIIDALNEASKTSLCVDGCSLVVAAARAANDAKNRTPAVIALDGRHWHEPVAPASAPKPWEREAYYGPTMCTGCGEHGHQRAACPHAPRPADAARRQATYAAAKGAMERRPQGHVPPTNPTNQERAA